MHVHSIHTTTPHTQLLTPIAYHRHHSPWFIMAGTMQHSKPHHCISHYNNRASRESQFDFSLSYAQPAMSDSDGFNPFDEGDTAPEPASPVQSSSPVSQSPSPPSSFLTASTSVSSIPPSPQSLASALSTSPSKPSILTDAKPNGHHADDHDKESLYEHLAHTDPAPSHADTGADSPPATSPHEPQPEPEQRPETSEEYGKLVSSEPSLFVDFRLSEQPDSYADALTSLSSLTTSLAALQAHYSSQHAAVVATSLDQQRHYQQQQTAIQADIAELQAQLATLEQTKQSVQQRLDTLHHSVTTKQHHHHHLTTQLTTLTAQYQHLSNKLTRRSGPTHRAKLRIHLFTLRPPTLSQRRIAVPARAIDGIFGCLTVLEVESVVRTCKRWQWVVGRNGVWKNGLRRIAGNKRRKDKEREETGQQVTMDEFDEWGQRDEQADQDVEVDEVEDGEHDMDGHVSAGKKKDDPAFHLTPAAAAALNLPPVDSPVPDHLHYALTVDLTRDLYSISITSRRITTLYQCAACMDSLTPGQPAPQLPKTSSVVICCTLVPKAASVQELQFMEQMMGMQEQMTVAKQDVQRLMKQVKEDGEVKRRLQTELSEREAELRRVQAELDFSMQQQMSDEMTRQFLDDSVNTTSEQLDEERKQTDSLRQMLRDAYKRREEEVNEMEKEAEGMVVVVDGLKEEKGRLTREVKRLQSELDTVTGERERAKREYERLMELVEQLRAL